MKRSVSYVPRHIPGLHLPVLREDESPERKADGSQEGHELLLSFVASDIKIIHIIHKNGPT